MVNLDHTQRLVMMPRTLVGKSLEWIQSYEDGPFLDPKWPAYPERFFFQKTHQYTLLRSFMSIYMHNIRVRCHSINEILIIKEKWNSTDQEQFCHNLRTRFFPHMQFLKNAKGSYILLFSTISRKNKLE